MNRMSKEKVYHAGHIFVKEATILDKHVDPEQPDLCEIQYIGTADRLVISTDHLYPSEKQAIQHVVNQYRHRIDHIKTRIPTEQDLCNFIRDNNVTDIVINQVIIEHAQDIGYDLDTNNIWTSRHLTDINGRTIKKGDEIVLLLEYIEFPHGGWTQSDKIILNTESDYDNLHASEVVDFKILTRQSEREKLPF